MDLINYLWVLGQNTFSLFLMEQVEIKRTIPKGAGGNQSKDFKTKKIFVGGIPSTVTEGIPPSCHLGVIAFYENAVFLCLLKLLFSVDQMNLRTSLPSMGTWWSTRLFETMKQTGPEVLVL